VDLVANQVQQSKRNQKTEKIFKKILMTKNSEIKILPARQKDFSQIWRIFHAIICKGDTYVNGANTTQKAARQKWLNKSAQTFVAKIGDEIVGAYLLKPNQVDRGSHIANASYIVDETKRGCGIGKALALHSIATAKKLEYAAMQFNFVVSTNTTAVKLWQAVGFKIIGTVPKAFNHPSLGYVDAFVMHLEL
jgi:L-amino acid N-acyltransferase YncA